MSEAELMEDAGSAPAKSSLPPRGAPVRFGDFTLDLDGCLLSNRGGGDIPLTRSEFALLREFARHPARVLSRDYLLDALGGKRPDPFDRSIDMLVGRLRKKIETDPKQPRLIVTVPGEGYRFDGLTRSLSPEQRPSIAAQASQDDDGGPDMDPESDLPLANRPATFGATGGAKAPMPEQREATPIAARPSEGARPPAEAAPGGAERRRVTALAAEAVRVEGAKLAAPKKGSALLSLAVGIAALLVLIGGVGWWFVNANRSAAVASKAPAEVPRLSMVVLPFTNLANDPAQDYFADGVTDNLTTELSRLHNSFVIARNTAFTFKGKNLDAKAIGKELGVRYVLEGSVQRDANRVRVNAQLIDAASGAHLWADRFEEDVVDLFKLQDEVVARLARTLQIELVNAEAQRSLHDRPRNPDAIDLTMRGWAFYNQAFTKANQHEALALFDQALTLDPTSADALAAAAFTEATSYANGWYDPGADPYARAMQRANQAILLNPDQAVAHLTKALLIMFKTKPDDAASTTEIISESEASLRADPSLANAYLTMAIGDHFLGHDAQAISDLKQAIRISPRDTYVGIWYMQMGLELLGLGRYDEAIEEGLKAVDSGYHTVLSYTALAAFYAAADKMPEAKAGLAEAMKLNPKLSLAWFRSHNSAWVDTQPTFRENLLKAGLPEE
jgi:TolB-like protein/DNA-binding winged helix-turn-helix (wHTH) protein